MTTLAMDQWGWKPQVAITRMGFIIMGAGAISIVVFGLIGPLSKRQEDILNRCYVTLPQLQI